MLNRIEEKEIATKFARMESRRAAFEESNFVDKMNKNSRIYLCVFVIYL